MERIDRRLRPILAKIGVEMKNVRAARNLFAVFVHVDKWRDQGEEIYRTEARRMAKQLAQLLPKNEKLECLQTKELEFLRDHLSESPLRSSIRALLGQRSKVEGTTPD